MHCRPTLVCCTLLLGGLWTLTGSHSILGQTSGRTVLLAVTSNERPNDTGNETTRLSFEEHKELGGQALKVQFGPGDSFGVQQAKVTNWKPYASLRFEAVNPSNAEVTLSLNVRHRRSTNFPTRIHQPFTLKPGKNTIRLNVAEMTNVNKTAADLEHIVRWYIAAESGQAPTVLFGDIVLESAPGGNSAGTESSGRSVVTGDPARLARIRAQKMPPFDKPIAFDTPEADAILSALEVYPADNPWNLVVEDWPLHPNSKNIIASIGVEKPLRYNPDMSFVIVPPSQPKIDLKVVEYPDESDKGPFPVPETIPIEGWPANYQRSPGTKSLTLDDVQRDKLKQGGDRHAIVVDPVNRRLYEFYQMRKTDTGWQAAQTSIFDLTSNKLRPDGWTSADAAGLPIFPAVVRYDELQRGVVEHALRVTVVKTRRAYVHPATHYASRRTDDNLPRMGERIRLRRDFDVSRFSREVKPILVALKRYGMFVADNGIDWAISVTPDPRISVLHEELRKVKGSDFEVVQFPPGYKP